MASSFKKNKATDTKQQNTPHVVESNDLNFQLENLNNRIETIKEELSGSK